MISVLIFIEQTAAAINLRSGKGNHDISSDKAGTILLPVFGMPRDGGAIDHL